MMKVTLGVQVVHAQFISKGKCIGILLYCTRRNGSSIGTEHTQKDGIEIMWNKFKDTIITISFWFQLIGTFSIQAIYFIFITYKPIDAQDQFPPPDITDLEHLN